MRFNSGFKGLSYNENMNITTYFCRIVIKVFQTISEVRPKYNNLSQMATKIRFFRAISSVVRQMPGYSPQTRGTARTLPSCCAALCMFLCCSMYCLFCDVPSIVCVYMCTEQLPPGGYTITVKYIIIISNRTAVISNRYFNVATINP